MQKEELEKTKNWLVGDEKGVKLRACLVSPSKTRLATYWAHPKVESPHTDAWLVALGKGDLMQKEELKKTKNWLVGDEKGVKLRACLVSPSNRGGTRSFFCARATVCLAFCFFGPAVVRFFRAVQLPSRHFRSAPSITHQRPICQLRHNADPPPMPALCKRLDISCSAFKNRAMVSHAGNICACDTIARFLKEAFPGQLWCI